MVMVQNFEVMSTMQTESVIEY